jgi:hypothetical protein
MSTRKSPFTQNRGLSGSIDKFLIKLPTNEEPSSSETVFGIKSDFISVHTKHKLSIRVSCTPDSNVMEPILFRLSHSPAKHDLPKLSTVRGMQIEPRKQHRKQPSSILFNRDSLSKTILSIRFDRLESPAKDNFPRTSTDCGMQIESNEQCRKQKLSILVRRESPSKAIVAK